MHSIHFHNGVKSGHSRKIRNWVHGATAVCLMVVLTCGLSVQIRAQTPTDSDTGIQIDTDRLINVLETRRRLPDADFLISLLEHPDPRSRWLAARDLGETKDTQNIPLLVPLLDDPNPEVRRQTRQALINLCANRNGLYAVYQKAMIGLSRPGRLMAQAVWDDSKDRRRDRQYYQQAFNADPQRYWTAFHAMPPEQIINRIKAPLSKDIARIESQINRFMADPGLPVPVNELRYAFALAVFAETMEREIARTAFNSNDLKDTAELRQQAAGVLSKVRSVAEKAKTLEVKLSQQKQKFSPSDFDPGLAESLSLAQARALAAHELGSVNTPKVAAALQAALASDPDPLVRVRAAESLGKLCPPDIHQALIQSVQADPSEEVKRAALIALGCCDNKDSRRIIREYAEKPEYLEAAILATANLGAADDLDFLFKLADKILATSSDDNVPSLAEPDFEPVINALVQALKNMAPQYPNDQPTIDAYIQSLTLKIHSAN